MAKGCPQLRVRNPLAREFLAELLGTFILILFGDASVAQAVLGGEGYGNQMSIHWSWGVGVMMGVYAAGGVSGGHLNPAVSMAQACLGNLQWRRVPVYMLAQYLGSFLASGVIFVVYLDALTHHERKLSMLANNGSAVAIETYSTPNTAGIWATYPQPFASVWTCFVDQIVGTGALLLCVMAVTDKRNMEAPKGLVPVLVGLIVFVIGMTFGLNCGYAINPARDLAPRIFTAIAGWGRSPFSFNDHTYFWIPVVGPHLGAIIGAFLYQILVGNHWPAEDEEEVPKGSQGESVEYLTKDNRSFGMDEQKDTKF